MKLEEAIKQLKDLKKDMKKDTKGSEGIFMEDIEAISTILQELKHLQKENEELKEIDTEDMKVEEIIKKVLFNLNRK